MDGGLGEGACVCYSHLPHLCLCSVVRRLLRLVLVSLLSWICHLTLAPAHHPELWTLYKLIGVGMCPAYSSMLWSPKS